jgi:hypothetical protein
MAVPYVGRRLGAMPADETQLARRLTLSGSHVTRTVAEIEAWLAERRRSRPFHVAPVPFGLLDGWNFVPGSGDLVHETGRFFSVVGTHVRTDYGHVHEWWQPIIDQPDGAILGIVAKETDGVLRFLMQAKMEPGNVNAVQLSPTVQATPSNFLRVHKGHGSRYIEYFTEPGRARVLVDVLQSEQGSWFRGKRNRNVVAEATGEVAPHDDFIWLTLGEILALLRRPHLLNMDARTVLSCLPLPAPEAAIGDDGFRAALRSSIVGAGGTTLHSHAEVQSWLSGRKVGYALSADPVPLNSVIGWRRNDREIYHEDGRYFTVVGVSVQATNREVGSWCQPLLAPRGEGLVAFVVRRIDGVLYILARADLRSGYRDTVELGPTVQCTPDNYANLPDDRLPRYLDLVRSPGVTVHYDVRQSEEGGRFQRALTRHVIVEVDDAFPIRTPPDFLWVTAAQLTALTRASYQVNIEARSLALCLHGLR